MTWVVIGSAALVMWRVSLALRGRSQTVLMTTALALIGVPELRLGWWQLAAATWAVALLGLVVFALETATRKGARQ